MLMADEPELEKEFVSSRSFLRSEGKGLFDRVRYYFDLSRAKWMTRRYFVINAFDGSLAMLGIVMGSIGAGVKDPRVIVSIGLSAAIAMGISGASGAYMSERAERLRELKGIERAMLRGLKGTVLEASLKIAPVFIAIVDALAPLVMAAITLAPFALAMHGMYPASLLPQTTIAITLAELFVLGAYLGKISRENVLKWGLQTLGVGVLTALIVLAIGATKI